MNKEAISEFKQIYFDEYNVVLSDKEATERAVSFFNLFKVLFKNSATNQVPKIVLKDDKI